MSDTPRGVEHTDSIDSHDSAPKQPEKTKSRRPPSECRRPAFDRVPEICHRWQIQPTRTGN
ncbi:LEM3/CDC50 family protein, partial [Metarhizium majus ARSEF 297]